MEPLVRFLRSCFVSKKDIAGTYICVVIAGVIVGVFLTFVASLGASVMGFPVTEASIEAEATKIVAVSVLVGIAFFGMLHIIIRGHRQVKQ